MSWGRAEATAWLLALVGAGLLALAAGTAPASIAHAWLASLTLWMGWPLGSMAVLLVHALTGGRWGLMLRGPLRAGLSTLPLLLLALLPWVSQLPRVYPWLRSGEPVPPNHFYLNGTALALRGTVYLAVWLGLGVAVLRALRAKDPTRALRRLAPPGLIALAFTITFASIDLTMSLDPRFVSSIYGLITLVSMGLTALAASVLILAGDSARPAPAAVAALGKLMQGLVLFWGYLDFMQLLILWQSNLATDSAWYLARMSHGWQYFALGITCCHFLLPAAVLIFTPARHSWNCLCAVAALVLAGEILRAWWLVLPAAGLHPGIAEVGAVLLLPGMGAALVLRRERAYG